MASAATVICMSFRSLPSRPLSHITRPFHHHPPFLSTLRLLWPLSCWLMIDASTPCDERSHWSLVLRRRRLQCEAGVTHTCRCMYVGFVSIEVAPMTHSSI